MKNSFFKSAPKYFGTKKKGAVMDEEEIADWFKVVRKTVELKSNPINFDSFVGWDEKDIFRLLGVQTRILKYCCPIL